MNSGENLITNPFLCKLKESGMENQVLHCTITPKNQAYFSVQSYLEPLNLTELG